MTAQTHTESPHIPQRHRERFRLAELAENEGEGFRPRDYMSLVLATLVGPALLVVLAWLV